MLAPTYHGARNTVRAAIQELIQEGLVRSEHGRGLLHPRASLLDALWPAALHDPDASGHQTRPVRRRGPGAGKTPRVEVRSAERVPADVDVAERLGIEPGTDVVRRENWYFADEVPMQVGITFIPWSIAKGTALAKAENLGKRRLYGRLEDLGYTIANVREEITAQPATREEAEGLDLPPGVPMIDLWHTGMTAEKQPFEVTNFYMRADYSALDYDMPVDY
ncbi:GntR family transcriptional regulator [Promicromonospora umidemergens]|uniref:GntR family transcriptional regulator n=1 Tax=Promicromonospora umidemergens TaxID=629679 RepID=A0ABP8WUT3_9MICO